MVSWICRNVRSVLQTKPWRLWGVSLLAGLLTWLGGIGFVGVPAVAFCLDLALTGSLALLFLEAYRGNAVESRDLFTPFRREQLPHLVGGMAWMSLWVFLWFLIPVAGLVLGPMKLYTYRFTPYILLTRPDVKATEAIQVSARETQGYRGKMFLVDLLIYGALILAALLLTGLAQIPWMGPLFYTLLVVVVLLAVFLIPLFTGLIRAGFYDEVQHCLEDPSYSARFAPPTPPAYTPPAAGQQPPQPGTQYCPICGQPAPKAARFCNNCGTKLDGSTLG
ncbi:MAG TPA: hypothetical protein IAD05_00405 [Candidatus Faecousia gallistercoris]|nr:hypothetical protein [Candidatus Faecousia gallistercoris]